MEKKVKKPSGVTQRSVRVAPGSTVKLGFKGDTGLVPTADIYDPSNNLVSNDVSLKEINGTGVYEYVWEVAKDVSLGDYTAIVQESSSGALDSMTITVAKETSGGGAAGGGVSEESEKAVKDTSSKVTTMSDKLDTLMTKLSNIELLKRMNGASGSSETVVLQSVQEGIDQSKEEALGLARASGVALPQELMTMQKEQGGEIKGMKNDVERVRNIVEAIRKSVGSDKPVIQQWMESGSVILKVLAINPSKEEAQEAPLKLYLPVEAKPDNVLNRDELNIQFDTAQNLYYAEKIVELKPGESYTMMVHIEDIWTISSDELKSVRDRADKAIALLPTHLMDVAKLLYGNITATLNTIETRQKNDSEMPQEHIANYRNNVKLLEEAMKDLGSIEQLLIQSASSSGKKMGDGAQGNEGSDQNPLISTSMTWKLMLGIISFLAIVSIASFAIWSKQLKDLMKPKEVNMLPPEERASP
jgi:hypothetical protein